MRRPRAIGSAAVIGAVALVVSCTASFEHEGSMPCQTLHEVFARPGRTWVRAAIDPVDPATFPDAQEVLASDLTQDVEWGVVRLVDPVLLVAGPLPASDPTDPSAPAPERWEQVPGSDGRTPEWALIDGAAAAHMADRVPADGWLLEMSYGGTVANAVGIDGGAATFFPGTCNDLSTRSLADSAMAVGRTPEGLAVALIQGDPTVPELPGSTVPG